MGTQQNTTTPRTLDEKAEQLLLKARSLTRADEARGVAEVLEKMLDPKLQITLSTRRRCFRGLVKLCGEYGVLPSPYIIPDSKVEKLGDEPMFVGGFSRVWPGMYEGERAVAIKIIQYYGRDGVQAIKKSFCREVITWKRLSHPNILELIGVMMDDGGCAMVSPWMENGNIVDYVREEPHVNPLRLLEEATRGLQYLHSVDLAHGDLKGANILISEEGHACLADVGLTRVAGDLSSNTGTTGTTSTEGANSPRWCPPEILDPERFGFKRGGPTKKSDVYSMAMTIYQVLTDRIPFHDCSDLNAILRIGQGLRPEKPIFAITRGYTEELWDMTVSCWKENPIERPIVDKLLEALKVAGERWRPRRGWPSTLSPQDDRSPTLCPEESDSHTLSEPEDDHVTESPTSCHSPHSFATKSPVFAIPPPLVAEDKASPVSPDKENTDPPRNDLSGGDSRSLGEEYKPIPIPREEVTNDVSMSRTRNEDPEKRIQQIPATPETEGVQRTPPALSEARFRVPLSAGEVQGMTPIELNFPALKGNADTALATLPQSPPKSTPANQPLYAEDPGPPAPLELNPTPITAEASNSLISPQSSATQAPVPISLPTDPVHPLPVSTPSTANSGTPPRSRLTSAASRKDLVNPVVPMRPGGEESMLVSFVVDEEETRTRSVRSAREEELEPISVTSRKEGTKIGADGLLIHEERRPTLAPSKLEALKVAGERWRPRHGWTSTLSPQDDRSLTLCAKGSDSLSLPEPEDDHVTTEFPTSYHSLHSLATKRLVSTAPAPFLPVPPPLTTVTKASPGHDPVTSDKGKVEVWPTDSSRKDPGRTAIPSSKEHTEHALAPPPSLECQKPVSAVVNEGGNRSALVGSPGEGGQKLVSLTMGEPVNGRTSPHIGSSCFRNLVEVCETSGILPRSCIVPESKAKQRSCYRASPRGHTSVWEGEYGEERKAVAIKVLQQHNPEDQRIKANFCREAVIWKHLSHSNILPFIGATTNDREYAMISPWVDGGNIVEFSRKNSCNPLKLLQDAACGLRYLHSLDLIHGDVKGANILVSRDGHTFLADFGHTKFAGGISLVAATTHTSTCYGTVRWCPRELFGSKGGNNSSKKSDIYSMAMTIYEVLTGAVPFRGCGKLATTLRIMGGERPPKPIFANTLGYTQELWELTTLCWREQPTERPTIDHVLESLQIAARQWEPLHRGLSPREDWNPTLHAEESDSHTFSEPEDECEIPDLFFT